MIRKYMKTFFFSSKSEELYFAHVYRINSEEYHVCVCDKDKLQIGEVRLLFSGPKLRYIYNLFVNNDFRGEYIGSYMIQILDYLIRTWKYKIIYGVFEPFELYLDNYDRKELLIRDIRFYKRNHFDIINFGQYLIDENKFSDLDESYFGINRTKTLVYRDYEPEKYLFNDLGDIVVHNNAIIRLDEIESLLYDELACLKLKI